MHEREGGVCLNPGGREEGSFVWESREHFRVNAYGNVITNLRDMFVSIDGCLCFFDVYHVWPWSRRGGLVRCNMAAVQVNANRHVKNDKIVPVLTAEEM